MNPRGRLIPGTEKEVFHLRLLHCHFDERLPAAHTEDGGTLAKKGKETMMKISFPEGFVHYPLHLAA